MQAMSDWIVSPFSGTGIEFSSVHKANWLTESNLVISVDGPAVLKGSQQMGSVPILARGEENMSFNLVSLKGEC